MFGWISRVHNRLKGYRTIIWGGVTTIPGIYLTFYDSFKDMGLDPTPIFGALNATKLLPMFTVVAGIVAIIIRLDTKGRVGDKTPHEDGQ